MNKLLFACLSVTECPLILLLLGNEDFEATRTGSRRHGSTTRTANATSSRLRNAAAGSWSGEQIVERYKWNE
jgi:hypothetical protein